MGCYINSKEIRKEKWLIENGAIVGSVNFPNTDGVPSSAPPWNSYMDDQIPVILIDSGSFTAAVICYCEKEYNEFIRKEDKRSRVIFSVEINLLYGVSDLEKYYKIEK